MATIRPIRGLRYAENAGAIDHLVAPPYDVISDEMRQELASRNAHNVVGLTLPESSPDDRSKFVKYARSKQRLEEWRRDGVMKIEPSPCYYRYTQTYNVPGSDEKLTRTSLIALIKVEPYSNKVVLPHEQTFPKHKEDRMRILEATGSHLECIFGLFEDEGGHAYSAIESAKGVALQEFTTVDDGIVHKLEKIEDGLEQITSAIAPSKVWIADGHHRYETALAYRERFGDQSELIPEDFMLMALCSIEDPGLILLPTHRILKRMPITGEELKSKMAEHFEVEVCANTYLKPKIQEHGKAGRRAFGIALPGGNGFTAVVKDLAQLAGRVDIEGGKLLKELDVSLLHGFIFSKLLGLQGHDFFDYTRSSTEAITSVESGAPAAFLMNPPTIEDMKDIAASGDFMPQKSTYYYPKLLSGLVVWSHKDFE